MKNSTSNSRPIGRVFHTISKLALFLALVLITTEVACAGSATWNLDPTDGDWLTAANWTPATVPNGETDTATFDVSNVTAVISRATIQLAGVVFEPGASAYSITIKRQFTFSGAGVSNNSGITQLFSLPIDASSLKFRNSATAGSAIFTAQGGDVFFYDSSSAGEGSFRMAGLLTDAVAEFHSSSTAGSAEFLNRAGDDGAGGTYFYDSAGAGTATFTCEGGASGHAYPGSIYFYDHSSAASATFIANAATASDYLGGFVEFYDRSTANQAIVTANGANVEGAYGGSVYFGGVRATAGTATLIANGGTNGGLGGKITFAAGSRGGSARVQLAGNAQLDLSTHDAPGLTIGSLEGDGTVILGSNILTVGRNNLDATFSGPIDDGLAGGSLTKTGLGTLSLIGANTYTGGTIVEAGYLLIDNESGSATGAGPIQINGGTFGGQGSVVGPVTVGTGSGFEPYLEPGARGVPGRLLIQRDLTFNSDGEFQWQLNSDTGAADHVVSKGVTIIGEAEIHFNDFGSSTLAPGTAFTLFSNTAAKPISGSFDELADGEMVTIGSNTFQADYEGGDGNDLTLTVVP
jgi:autotransporter-associated beta strand protein